MNRPIYKKWWFWLIIVLVIGAIGNMSESKNEADPAVNSPTESVVKQEDVAKEDKSDPAVEQASAPQQEEDKTEQYAAYVDDFMQEISEAENKANPVFENYVEKMNAAADGSASLLDAYEAAKKAKEQASQLHADFFKIKVPSDLPKDAKSLLEEAKTELSTAYFVREKAYKSAMAYLDEQKVSHLDAFKENMESSDKFMLSGATKMAQAKLSLEDSK
ncbi:hypothetical protein [Paenibacillus bouchesdurhonensis]|uniref:hypothetical protein n=1 Tax=Paenibacillus bouchesdurhonensis TaxID=1870990 RepID=UPI000DA62483|nr:hypothetical protein [Paenibacillus bouchesdurhonensis]